MVPSNRSGLGESSEPMVESSGGCAFTGGGVLASVGKSTSGTSDDCFVQCESYRVLGDKEVVREAANSHLLYGQGTDKEGTKVNRMNFEGGGEADVVF